MVFSVDFTMEASPLPLSPPASDIEMNKAN